MQINDKKIEFFVKKDLNKFTIDAKNRLVSLCKEYCDAIMSNIIKNKDYKQIQADQIDNAFKLAEYRSKISHIRIKTNKPFYNDALLIISSALIGYFVNDILNSIKTTNGVELSKINYPSLLICILLVIIVCFIKRSENNYDK